MASANHTAAECIQNSRSDLQTIKVIAERHFMYLGQLCVMTSSSIQTVTKKTCGQNKLANMCTDL